MAVFSQSSIDNRNFFYRVPRYKTDAPMDLVLGDHVNIGVCKEISEAGLRAQFALPVQTDKDGSVTIYSGEDRIQLPVHIDAIRGDEIAMQFSSSNEDDRRNLKNFIRLLVERGSSPVTD